jgi:uncharacterized protein (TIRG00374 family)
MSSQTKPHTPTKDTDTKAPPHGLKPLKRSEPPEQPQLDRRKLERQLILVAVIIGVVVALITLVPGLASLRERFEHGKPEWLAAAVVLKILSGLSYVVVFRAVFCPRMSWRLSGQIGLAELGANAVVPTGGAGGLALGAWALRRRGMDADRIGRRSVAFFFLTSIPNVLGVIILGFGMAAGIFQGHGGLALALVPAIIATLAIALTIAIGRWADHAHRRLEQMGNRPRLRRALAWLGGGVRETLALLREHDAWLLVGLIGYLAFDVFVLWATFHAFGGTPALSIVWFGYLIGELGGLIPVPGGIGGVDLGLVGTLVLYGVKAWAATAAVLAYRAIALWVPAVIGAGAFLFLRRSLARETKAIETCGPDEEVDIIGRGRVTVGA